MFSFRTLQIASLTLAVLVVSACGAPEFKAGPTRTETRTVGSFDSIDLDGSARLIVTVGADESVSLEGPDNILDRVTTEVDGDTLRIRTRAKDWVWSNGQPRVVVSISVPHLKSLRLEGGNDVRLNGFKGGESRLEVRGAAHLRASGELDALTVDMEGAGFADLGELVANEAQVTVDGIGRVIVHPKDRLDATMNGIGAILYAGSPREVNTHMNGLGTISQSGRDRGKHDRADRRKQREAEREWKRHRNDTPEERAAPGSDAKPEINPDDLQPEYDNRPQKIVDMTEVI